MPQNTIIYRHRELSHFRKNAWCGDETIKNGSSFGSGSCERAHCESRPMGSHWENLLYRRTGASPQFKDCESMLNLILRLAYNDFKSNRGYDILLFYRHREPSGLALAMREAIAHS